MDLYRTSESGLVAVQPLDLGETAGLAGALLQGPGGELGAEDVLFVTTADDDGSATALALDAEGATVVVRAADGEVGSDAVTNALERASAVADRPYEALDEQYDGELREAHADYFDREPLAPEAFNRDQHVRLLGTAFADEALDLATFLSDREVAVDPVRVEAFGAPASEEYLVRFAGGDGETVDADEAEPVVADGSEQWVAGTDSGASAEAAAGVDESGERDSSEGSGASSHEPGLGASEDGAGETGADDADGADEPSGDAEDLELPVLLEAVAEGVQDRLVGTFEGDPEDLVSVERGNEMLVRPDHPAYAGGVLRYRLRVQPEGDVDFEVSIYGGSEAEKEQMRAVIRENADAIEEELGYEVAEDYGGFSGTREFASYDQVAAAEIVDEFDRLVRFFNPRVMRA
ncbi:hypothetical protein B4589_005020 [Halolamina sp. CBA1230]|uniref:hypothetical protein n=1 Tax=Halolamina sp. CBA1230 TaxID=1853690 RepID=UPI0009A15B8D|nr:hypothetical protein [Halolamina sp. CBA1230]QKY19772.1 hypothetical protein B4589_005020 [Halolamina sp. CBA1230]